MREKRESNVRVGVGGRGDGVWGGWRRGESQRREGGYKMGESGIIVGVKCERMR